MEIKMSIHSNHVGPPPLDEEAMMECEKEFQELIQNDEYMALMKKGLKPEAYQELLKIKEKNAKNDQSE